MIHIAVVVVTPDDLAICPSTSSSSPPPPDLSIPNKDDMVYVHVSLPINCIITSRATRDRPGPTDRFVSTVVVGIIGSFIVRVLIYRLSCVCEYNGGCAIDTGMMI